MEYLAKKVVDGGSGKVIGYVLDEVIDFQTMKLDGLYVVDEETEGEYLLRLDDVDKVGDVVIVSDFSKLEFVTSRERNLFGKEVLSVDGKSLGHVQRLVFDKKRLKFVCTDKGEIATKLLGYVGDDCIFLRGKAKRKRSVKPFQMVETEQKVETLNARTEVVAPEKINLSYSFFAGKVATHDVFGYNNERIILKNEKITKNIFENAKKHNKLNELFFATKKQQ